MWSYLGEKELQEIILNNRGTTLEASPKAFLETFYDNAVKMDKWIAFLRDISHEPIPLEKVISDLKSFFTHVFKEI